MKAGLLEWLLSLSAAGSGGDKAANQTPPQPLPVVVSSSQPLIKSKSKITVEAEVQQLVDKVLELFGLDPGGGGSNENGP